MADQSVGTTILTPREVEVIKQYVALATRLKASFQQMKEYWGGGRISSKYEEQTDVYGKGVGSIITNIVKHADEWPAIEREVKTFCGKVSECSGQFKSLADPVVEEIEKMPLYIEYSRTLKQEVDEALENTLSCDLCFEDMQKLWDIEQSVTKMESMIMELEPELNELSDSIQAFKESLMNDIQTEIDAFVKLDTATEMDEKLLHLPLSEYQRGLLMTYMGVIRGVVLKVIMQSPGQSPEDLEALVTEYMQPDYKNHIRQYNETLEGLSEENKAKVEALISQTKKGQVLFSQLESLHDWLNQFGQPLISANKGVGQIRTIWSGTSEDLRRINDRVKQVKRYSTLRNIVNSLKSALKPWSQAGSNARTVKELLERAY